jgi:hypothetical protein
MTLSAEEFQIRVSMSKKQPMKIEKTIVGSA